MTEGQYSSKIRYEQTKKVNRFDLFLARVFV